MSDSSAVCPLKNSVAAGIHHIGHALNANFRDSGNHMGLEVYLDRGWDLINESNNCEIVIRRRLGVDSSVYETA